MEVFSWIDAHIGTILISLGLAALVAGIVVWMVLDKKKAKAGKTCGGCCGDCSGCRGCH